MLTRAKIVGTHRTLVRVRREAAARAPAKGEEGPDIGGMGG